MPQCLIIADDLTGANATGVLLQKISYRSYTVTDIENFEKRIADTSCDCIICPTDSRGIDSEVAYEHVYLSVQMLRGKDTTVFGKRIDSTLRGNLGSETDAMLDALGDDFIAIVVPCFPESGRIVCGGFMLVHAVPLHKTEAAIDPKTPVKTSNVITLFRKQSKYDVAHLDIDDLMRGKLWLAKRIQQLKRKGVKIIIFDCISREDIDLIADAAVGCGIPFFSVDPGPFTAAVIRKRIIPEQKKALLKILAVVGSVNPVAKIQLDEFLLSQKVFSVAVNTEKLIKDETSRKNEITRVVSAFSSAGDDYQLYCIYGEGIVPEKRVDFSLYTKKFKCTNEDLSNTINTAFAEITYALVEKDRSIRGLYTSGGDITVAVNKKSGTAAISLLGEVLPLAAYGEIVGGMYDGLKIVTKGGMAGDRDAMKQCVQYLKEHLFM